MMGMRIRTRMMAVTRIGMVIGVVTVMWMAMMITMTTTTLTLMIAIDSERAADRDASDRPVRGGLLLREQRGDVLRGDGPIAGHLNPTRMHPSAARVE